MSRRGLFLFLIRGFYAEPEAYAMEIDDFDGGVVAEVFTQTGNENVEATPQEVVIRPPHVAENFVTV